MVSEYGIGQLRCADSDRELVAELLNRAYADGRLDYTEHSDRLTSAYQAKTFAELDELTIDLVRSSRPAQPEAVVTPITNPPVVSPPQPTAGTQVAPPNAFRGGSAFLGSVKPGQAIHLVNDSTVTVGLGDAKIDLVGATFDSTNMQLNVNAYLGEIRIRVPDGVNVVSDVNTVLAETKIRGLRPAPGGVTIHLAGTVALGEITVLGPDSPPRKYQKFVR